MTDASPLRRHHSSGGPWEDEFGYSRAIRTGDHIVVSGCTAVVDGAVRHPGDAGAQMRVALDNVLDAITALGGTLGDVIRTRMYVVDRADRLGRLAPGYTADVVLLDAPDWRYLAYHFGGEVVAAVVVGGLRA